MKRPAEAPKQAHAVLAAAVDALAAVGVTAWLTDGTLLGAIREGAFIEHDQDMDVGAMITEFTPAVIPALRAAGFTIRKTLGTPERGLQHKLAMNEFRIDIFWHYDSPTDGVWHAAWDGKTMLAYQYDRLALAHITFLGRTFWAPTPPRLHLTQKYGPDWRTPRPDWDWARDPSNLKEET